MGRNTFSAIMMVLVSVIAFVFVLPIVTRLLFSSSFSTWMVGAMKQMGSMAVGAIEDVTRAAFESIADMI